MFVQGLTFGDEDKMYVSSISMKGRAEKRKEIVQTICGLCRQVKDVEGCLSSTVYQDISDENSFYIVKEWGNQKALDRYLSSRLFAVLLGIESILAEKPKVRILAERGQ